MVVCGLDAARTIRAVCSFAGSLNLLCTLAITKSNRDRTSSE